MSSARTRFPCQAAGGGRGRVRRHPGAGIRRLLFLQPAGRHAPLSRTCRHGVVV